MFEYTKENGKNPSMRDKKHQIPTSLRDVFSKIPPSLRDFLP